MTPDMVEELRKQGRHDIADEIERLRNRILELEALHAALRGTLSEPEEPQMFGILHDVPPNTPR